MNIHLPSLTAPLGLLRGGIAAVWIVFGLFFKVLGLLPRHRAIVARVCGERYAGPLTRAIGVGELGLGLWTLTAALPLPICAALQTAAILAMNTLELRRARGLLLTPWGMIAANTGLLAATWVVALNAPA